MTNVVALGNSIAAMLGLIEHPHADRETKMAAIQHFAEIEYLRGRTDGLKEARQAIADAYKTSAPVEFGQGTEKGRLDGDKLRTGLESANDGGPAA